MKERRGDWPREKVRLTSLLIRKDQAKNGLRDSMMFISFLAPKSDEGFADAQNSCWKSLLPRLFSDGSPKWMCFSYDQNVSTPKTKKSETSSV